MSRDFFFLRKSLHLLENYYTLKFNWRSLGSKFSDLTNGPLTGVIIFVVVRFKIQAVVFPFHNNAAHRFKVIIFIFVILIY